MTTRPEHIRHVGPGSNADCPACLWNISHTKAERLDASRIAHSKAAASPDLSLTNPDDPRRRAAEEAERAAFQHALYLGAEQTN